MKFQDVKIVQINTNTEILKKINENKVKMDQDKKFLEDKMGEIANLKEIVVEI